MPRCKKERIVLDAVVQLMVKSWVFIVKLENGHKMVGVVKSCIAGGCAAAGRLTEGCRVLIEATPCDMSYGKIISIAPGRAKL